MVTFFIYCVGHNKIYKFNFNTVIVLNIIFAYTAVRVAQIKYKHLLYRNIIYGNFKIT